MILEDENAGATVTSAVSASGLSSAAVAPANAGGVASNTTGTAATVGVPVTPKETKNGELT